MLIDSVPPAMTHSAMPAMIEAAAIAMVCDPEEQKRLTVTAGTSCGSPARKPAMRATFVPDSPSGVAQPMITSSIVSGGSAGTRRSRSSMTAAAMSSGLVVRRLPRGALPTAVRTPATITASLMHHPPVFENVPRPIKSNQPPSAPRMTPCASPLITSLPCWLRQTHEDFRCVYCSAAVSSSIVTSQRTVSPLKTGR